MKPIHNSLTPFWTPATTAGYNKTAFVAARAHLQHDGRTRRLRRASGLMLKARKPPPQYLILLLQIYFVTYAHALRYAGNHADFTPGERLPVLRCWYWFFEGSA